MSFTLTWRPKDDPNVPDKIWMHALGEVLDLVEPSHYAILSTLTLLSNSLFSCQSLPPHIPLPEPYTLTHQLLHLDGSKTRRGSVDDTGNHDVSAHSDSHHLDLVELRHILDAKNMDQTGYTEFAILQVCNTLVCNDLRGLILSISGLVGVVDFSFRVDESKSSLGITQSRQAVMPKREGSKGKGKED